MRTTKGLIEYNQGKLEFLTEEIEKVKGTNRVHSLREDAIRVQKRIKRYEQLMEMSGLDLMESIRALDKMWDVAKEYDHVRGEFADVEKAITDKLEELEKEHSRRMHEDMENNK